MADPRRPVDELNAMTDQLKQMQRRIDRLEAPSGTSAFQSVKKLTALITDLQAQVDAALAGKYTNAQIDARIASTPGAVTVNGDMQIAGGIAVVNGSGTIAGTLGAGGRITASGGITSLDVYGRTVVTGRKAVWIDSNGVMGVST